ncbi:MAG: NAD-dependent epimerase/dehydratase family protein [Gaiellaceae bacterium]
MRAFVTGATGFVGGRLARALRGRDDEVVALVRSRARAVALESLGCELVEGDLHAEPALRLGLEGCDAAFHCAADYRIGIAASERSEMNETNVRGTETVLDAAIEAGVARIVYVSTVNAFGDTAGQVVDEAYERSPGAFVSAYDETKYLAHRAARERIARGAPILIALPGVVYGPGDTSLAGGQIRDALHGKLLYLSFPTLGFNAVHVDDVVAGLLLVHDRGTVGESYVLGGQISTMREAIRLAAEAAGRRPPRLTMPTALVRLLAPLALVAGPSLGLPRNLREVISASDGVTYWASDAKARRELGYEPRDLETGLRDVVVATASR